MNDVWWWEIVKDVAIPVGVTAITGTAYALYRKVFKRPLHMMWNYRRRNCGHRSVSYAFDPRTETTACMTCYRAHDAASQSN